MTDNGENDQDASGDEQETLLPEEIPPPKIVKIEDYADISSPYASLDGATLAQPDGVAVARLASPEIGERDGDGVLIGESMADLAYVIGELGGSRGHVHVRELAFVKSVDLAFVTSGEVEQTLTGADSKERRGANRLARALVSPDAHTLLETVRGIDEHLAVRFEAMLKRLAESKVTVDFQTPATERPVRVAPERAAALYFALREPVRVKPYSETLTGRLVGAIADTRDFKLRLETAWHRRHVIEGKFSEGLEREMEQLWNKEALATVTVEEERRGVRTTHYKFHLDSIQAAPRLPLGD